MLRESNAADDGGGAELERPFEVPLRAIKDGIRCGRCRWVRFKFMPACPKCAYSSALEFDTSLRSDVMPARPRKQHEAGAAPAKMYREPIRSTGSRNDEPVPERELLEALLHEAIECLAGRAVVDRVADAADRAQKRRDLAREAEAWMRSDARTPITAFVPVCEALGLDPKATRNVLLHVAPVQQAA